MVIQSLSKRHESVDVFKYFVHLMAKGFLIAVLILLVFLFLFFSFYFGDLLINMKNGNNKVPLFGAYVIVSPSMVPTIKINDAIVVKRVSDSDLHIGDIITFSSNDSQYTNLTITHRIVSKQTTQTGEYVYRTKGDNNNVEDSSIVNTSDIYGKVFLKIPKIGYIQSFLSSPIGFIIAIIIPLGAVLIMDGSRLYKVFRNKDEELEII